MSGILPRRSARSRLVTTQIVGANTGVVEHLFRQGDDGLQPVVFDDPAADFTLAGTGATGEQRRAIEDDGNAGARLVTVAFFIGLKLADHVNQEQQRPVVDAGQLAVVAAKVGPALDDLLLGLPVHAEGRVGQQVVEAVFGVLVELVVDQGVAVFNTAALETLDQQVGGGNSVGSRVVVLTEDAHGGAVVVGAYPVLRLGEHAASAAGRVADGDDDPLLGEYVTVGLQQQVDHEADDLARGEVVTRGLVGRLVEAPDQVLEHQPHGDVVHHAGMQIDFRKFGDHQIEAVGLLHLLDLFLELEILEDLADVFGETVDVVSQMTTHIVRVALEFLKIQLAVIVETQWCPVFVFCSVIEHLVDQLAVLAFEFFIRGEDFSLTGFQYTVEAA